MTTTALTDTDTVPFRLLTNELLLNVASYQEARDLLQFQCVCRDTSQLSTNRLWKQLCLDRWKPWPRYRLTEQGMDDLEKQDTFDSWQKRYLDAEQDANRTVLKWQELVELDWYLSFVLSGIRGEGRSDHMPIKFRMDQNSTHSGFLLVPNYPPLGFTLHHQAPAREPGHIRPNLRGDRPFSKSQWLEIANFPPHYISRKKSDAEWLIVNENVIMVSRAREERE